MNLEVSPGGVHFEHLWLYMQSTLTVFYVSNKHSNCVYMFFGHAICN
jgi:hypothetical protein